MAKKVIIVGGGFGGLNAAKTLGNQADIEVVLIDKTNHHLFQPLLYQVAIAGLAPSDIAIPLRSLLNRFKNITVLMNEVTNIDEKNQRVTLKDNTTLNYDELILPQE
jgi:NADH dehydrogenase